MATFTTADLSRKVGDVLAAAHKGPVTLTQHRKPRFVLMTVERYEVLRKKADARTAARVADMPTDLVPEVSTVIDACLDNEAERASTTSGSAASSAIPTVAPRSSCPRGCHGTTTFADGR